MTTNDENNMLIEAWHSYKSVSEIAKELGLSGERVRIRWKRMRLVGLIPDGQRPSLRTLRDNDDADSSRLIDAQATDLLLKRLCEVHGAPRPDVYPGAK